MTRERLIGLITAAVAVGMAIYAVYGDPSADKHEKDTLWQVAALIVVVAALVFGLFLPWAEKRWPEKAGLVVSILGFLAVAAFWSGLPIVLGGAGATLGMVGRERVAGKTGLATAAIAVGVVAAILAIGITVGTNLFL